MICELTPTVMDGQVLRWWSDVERTTELASASRSYVNLVFVVPPDVRDAAEAAHRELLHNPDADMRHYVTHERERAFSGPLIPIRRPGQ